MKHDVLEFSQTLSNYCCRVDAFLQYRLCVICRTSDIDEEKEKNFAKKSSCLNIFYD